MAILWLDSFDDRTNPVLKYDSGSVGTNLSIVSSGRTGNRLQADYNVNNSLTHSLRNAIKTFYFGAAYAVSGLANITNLVKFRSGSTIHLKLQCNADRTLSILHGGGAVLAGPSAEKLSGTFAYLELSATIDDAVGAVTLKMNGVTILSAAGVDTRNGAAASIDNIKFDTDGVTTYYVDDLYLADDQFYGGLKIYALLPNAAGDKTQFAPSTSSNWTCVDEANPNDNTDYVYQSGTTSEDLYNYQNLTDSSQPYGIQLWTRHERDDAVVRKFTPQCKSSSTDSSFAEVTTSNGTYADDVQWMGIDPATGLPWTVAGINSAQFGIKITV